MNYRHIYHAGNFADVFKHIIIARIITYLKRKDAAFRVIDTHAGIGLYDLRSQEVKKTGEWHQGVGKFLQQPFSAEQRQLLEPWLSVITKVNSIDTDSGNALSTQLYYYPGSPVLIRHLLRKCDRLTALELHPEDYQQLARLFTGDYQARIVHLDGYLALKGYLPPKEKRGLILVDPPFEVMNEFDRLFTGFMAAYRRFSTGIFALWYPLKHRKAVEHFAQRLGDSAIANMLRVELKVEPFTDPPTFIGCGLILVNPPYVLKDELNMLTPLFQQCFKKDSTLTCSSIKP